MLVGTQKRSIEVPTRHCSAPDDRLIQVNKPRLYPTELMMCKRVLRKPRVPCNLSERSHAGADRRCVAQRIGVVETMRVNSEIADIDVNQGSSHRAAQICLQSLLELK